MIPRAFFVYIYCLHSFLAKLDVKEFPSHFHTVLRTCRAVNVAQLPLSSLHFPSGYLRAASTCNVQHATFMLCCMPPCFCTQLSVDSLRLIEVDTKWNEIMMSLTAIKTFDLVQRYSRDREGSKINRDTWNIENKHRT